MSGMETPRREGASPWKVVPIGCLGVAVLLGIAVGFLIFKGVRVAGRMAVQMQNPAPPADPKVVAARFAGVPIYPGAQLDLVATGQMLQMSDVAKKEWGVFAGSRMAGQTSAIHRVPAAPADIVAWYDQSMGRLGWKATSQRQRASSSAGTAMHSRTYQKGKLGLVVMASNSGSGGASEMILILTGVPAARTP